MATAQLVLRKRMDDEDMSEREGKSKEQKRVDQVMMTMKGVVQR